MRVVAQQAKHDQIGVKAVEAVSGVRVAKPKGIQSAVFRGRFMKEGLREKNRVEKTTH